MHITVTHRMDPQQFARLEAVGLALVVALSGNDQAQADDLAQKLRESSDRLRAEVEKLTTTPPAAP
jgi:hypothetical protein